MSDAATLLDTGPMLSDSPTCASAAPTTSRQLTLWPAPPPAKTSVPLARELAWLALKAAFGLNVCESSASSSLVSYAWKTSPLVRVTGCPQSGAGWDDSATRRFRSRYRQLIAELHTCADESSLLPTLTASNYGSNRGGARGRHGKERPSLQTMARAHTHGDGQPDLAEHAEVAVTQESHVNERRHQGWPTGLEVVHEIHGLPGRVGDRAATSKEIEWLGDSIIPQQAEVAGWLIRELASLGAP